MGRDLEITASNRQNRSPLSPEAERRKRIAEDLIAHRDPELSGLADPGLVADRAWMLAGKFLAEEAATVQREQERQAAISKRLDELARGT